MSKNKDNQPKKIIEIEGVKGIKDPHASSIFTFADTFALIILLLFLWAIYTYYSFAVETVEQNKEFISSQLETGKPELSYADKLSYLFNISILKNFLGLSDRVEINLPTRAQKEEGREANRISPLKNNTEEKKLISVPQAKSEGILRWDMRDRSSNTVDVPTNRERTSNQFGALDKNRPGREESEEIFEQKIDRMTGQFKEAWKSLADKLTASFEGFSNENTKDPKGEF